MPWIAATSLVALLAVACAVGSPGADRAGGAATPAPTGPSMSEPVTDAPAPSSGKPSATVTTSPERTPQEPPVAVLSGPGITAAEGEIGGYTYRDGGSDSPWLPAPSLERVRVATGATLSVRLAGNATITNWVARIAPASDRQGERQRGLARGGSERVPADVIRFPAPPSGEWVLMVELTYGGGLGSGGYYWRLEVD